MPGRIPELLEATAVDKYALLTPAKPFPIGEGLDLSLFYAAAIGMSDGLDQTCPVETEVQKLLRQIDRLIVLEAVKDRVRECREFRRFTEQEDDTVAWGIFFNRVRDHHQRAMVAGFESSRIVAMGFKGNNMSNPTEKPLGELTLRTLAMPADTNAAGDIFGGWVMAQMDLACGISAAERAKGRVVTVAVEKMVFAKPMKIGDTLSIYTHVGRVGRTSMTLHMQAWAQRYLTDIMEKVTEADFVMVRLDDDGKPAPIPPV